MNLFESDNDTLKKNQQSNKNTKEPKESNDLGREINHTELGRTELGREINNTE